MQRKTQNQTRNVTPSVSLFTRDKYIDQVISFVYKRIDFFAAPYLGYYTFDADTECHRRLQTVHIGETFQTWANGLTRRHKHDLARLTYELKSALGNDEDQWQTILVGADLFDDTCMYMGRDKNDYLKQLLEEKPALLTALLRCLHQCTVINIWYKAHGKGEINARVKTRKKEITSSAITRTNTRDMIELQKKQDFQKISYNNIIQTTYIYLDYFAQVACPNLDNNLQKIATHLKQTDNTDAFLSALFSESAHDNSLALRVLFKLDPELANLLCPFTKGEAQRVMLNWYLEHASRDQKILCQERLLATTTQQSTTPTEAPLNSSGKLLNMLTPHPTVLKMKKPESGKFSKTPTPEQKLAQEKIDLTARKTTFKLFQNDTKGQEQFASVTVHADTDNVSTYILPRFIEPTETLVLEMNKQITDVNTLCKPGK